MNKQQRFIELARYFLDALDMTRDQYEVVLDCILAVPAEHIPDSPSLRQDARAFVKQIVNGPGEIKPAWSNETLLWALEVWAREWMEAFGGWKR